jgi:hypothetical protein
MWGVPFEQHGLHSACRLIVAGRVKDVMLAGNAYSALKDPIAISREREWVSGRWAWFFRLFPYVQVGKLNVTA